jgi:nitrogen fixation protein FixH
MSMTRNFTGWHFTAILVTGFGVVVVVNLLMASLAVGSFGGVVVENSYVASQNFNSWLAEAARANALGWRADVVRSGSGRLEVQTEGLPAGAGVTAELRHPLGRELPLVWKLLPVGGGLFASTERLPEGRWIARIVMTAGEREMRVERPLG